ncbi:MAG: hypothetical protein ACPL4H_01740 [Anaerolineales bacterium]
MNKAKLSASPLLDNGNSLTSHKKGSSLRARMEILFWKILIRVLSGNSPKESHSFHVTDREDQGQNWLSLAILMAIIGLISGMILGFLLNY